jgi:hypothetical protein
MKANMQFWSYLTHSFLEWEMFRKNLWRESQHTFMFNNFFRKSCRL